MCREWLSPPDPLALDCSAYPGYTCSRQRDGGERDAYRLSRSLVLHKPACGTGRTRVQAILVFTMFSGRHGLKKTSQGPMGIEGSLLPEKALHSPVAYHLQQTSQGGFWLVTRAEKSQVEATGQVLGQG